MLQAWAWNWEQCSCAVCPARFFEEGLLCTIAGTVAILAQGTSWAVAVTQAFFWYMAQFFRGDTNMDQKAQLCEFCNTEDYCTLFWPTVLPLQVVPGFACSVASLNQSPGHQLPGCHSLRRGTLAGYLLGQGMPSTQVAGLMLLPHTPLPSSEATRVLKPPATN